jgi:hypothetical protein
MIERYRRGVLPSHNDGPRSSSGESYTVGYGKPPKQHQYQPGESGNSKGRPKGAKSTSTLLCETLDRKIDVRTGATVRKVSVREAILIRLAEAALKGNIKSAQLLLQRYDIATETAKPNVVDPDQYETVEEVIEALAKEGLNIEHILR